MNTWSEFYYKTLTEKGYKLSDVFTYVLVDDITDLYIYKKRKIDKTGTKNVYIKLGIMRSINHTFMPTWMNMSTGYPEMSEDEYLRTVKEMYSLFQCQSEFKHMKA